MSINYRDELNAEQLEAVCYIDGPMIILAGAGSGKTKTLVYRIAYLIEHGVHPENILLLTFTRKAANEMRERAKTLLGESKLSFFAGTYHSFCCKMIRKYHSFLELGHNFTVLSTTDTVQAIDFLRVEKKGLYKQNSFPDSPTCAKIFSMCVNKFISLHALLEVFQAGEYLDYEYELEQLHQEYTEYKQIHNTLDYDDMMLLFDRLLTTCPQVQAEISDQFRYIMVDEYQDTNKLQEKILLGLCMRHRNIAVVGDDAQSIYGFRGSDVHNLLTFSSYFVNCKTVHLTTNYRSNQEIVALTNEIINQNTGEDNPKSMRGTYSAGFQPSIVCVDNKAQEAALIMGQIQNRIDAGVPLSEIAVLARRSKAFEDLEALLIQRQIPYMKYGGSKFIEHTCVQDFVAYLRCTVNDLDILAWFRILQLYYGIGPKYAKEIASSCNLHLDFLVDSKWQTHQFFPHLQELYNEIQTLRELDYTSQCHRIKEFYLRRREQRLDECNYTKEIRRIDAEEQFQKDQKLIGLLMQMTADYPSALDFIDALSTDHPSKQEVNFSEAITLSTIHSAKGLEYNTVFAMECTDGVFPYVSEKMLNDHPREYFDENEEELRCFYVALTRAKEELLVTVPRHIDFPNCTGKISHYLKGLRSFYQLHNLRNAV